MAGHLRTLHLFRRSSARFDLAKSPWLNHSWHVTLYVSARGLTTSPIPDGARTFTIDFDFIDHILRISTSDVAERQFSLTDYSVASFYVAVMAALKELGIAVTIDEKPNELPDPIRFSQDDQHASYDPDAVRRFFQILVNSDRVFKQFRTGFLGKASPVHFFWGSFDLAVTRFSGHTRRATRAVCRTPPDSVASGPYSHEVSSAGSAGQRRDRLSAFYSCAIRSLKAFAPPRCVRCRLFNEALGEFILPTTPRTATRQGVAGVPAKHLRGRRRRAAKWDRDALDARRASRRGAAI